MSSVNEVTSAQMTQFMKTYSNSTVEKEAAQTAAASDKDIFLNLLVTQMQYQDPLDPQDNSEFLSQMAQFTTLEIMENMGHSSEMTQASNMIGKLVSATDEDGKAIMGIVDGTRVINGDVFLRIGEKDVSLSKVQAITATENAESKVLNYTELSYANSLVGKIVSGTEQFEDGSLNDWTALVQCSTFDEDGNILLRAYNTNDGSDREIHLSDIKEVTEMVDASEDILVYVKELYDILTQETNASEKIEEELQDVTE